MATAVTPRAGVWIEIMFYHLRPKALTVTPRAGVWIEISCHNRNITKSALSHPVRVCGLKYIG